MTEPREPMDRPEPMGSEELATAEYVFMRGCNAEDIPKADAKVLWNRLAVSLAAIPETEDRLRAAPGRWAFLNPETGDWIEVKPGTVWVAALASEQPGRVVEERTDG